MMLALLLAAAVGSAPAPADLFTAERAADGGAAWASVGEIVERGTFRGSGLTGPYVSYVDPKTGRSRSVVTVAGSVQAQGYDALGAWSQQGTLVEPLDDAASTEAARTSAYIARNGWWNPATDPATFESLGQKQLGGTAYDVVRVVPQGGYPIEAWLDETTHLLVRTVVTDASNVATTTTYSDYRPTHGVLYPFGVTVSDGNPKDDQRTTVTSVEFLPAAILADLTRPVNRRTGSIANGTSTTLPFDLDDPLRGHVIVAIRVNGSRPLHVIFDTGGSNVVTPEVAREIGLHGSGAVSAGGAGEQQSTLQIANGATIAAGAATLRDQQIGILALPPSLVGMMASYRIDGIVGYEMLKNFVVSIDYVHRRLTLTDPSAFGPPKGAAAIHFKSNTVPVIPARVDGIGGAFMFDTGNAFYSTLAQSFVTAHSLESRLPGTILVQSSGNLGGALRPRLTRVTSFEIGPYRIDEPVFAITNTSKGALAGTAFAGNVGEAILTRFDVALDYDRSIIYLKPNANFGKPFVGSLDGMSIDRPDARSLRVSYVNAGTPAAAAGLAAGDRIVSVDGVPAANLGLAGLSVAEQRGRPLEIVFERGAVTKTTTLVPRETVP